MNFIAIFYVIFFVILMFSIILMLQHVIRHFHKNVQEDNEDEQKMKDKEKKMMIQRTNQKNKLDNMLKECSKEKDKIHIELIKLKKEHQKVKQDLTKEKVKNKQSDDNIMFTSVVNSNELSPIDDKKMNKNITLEKCCFVNKYNCSGKECTSGVEKRCGHFANDDCSNSLKLCKFFNKNECNKKPNNVYCEYDDLSNQCINRDMDYGFEINCGKYDRFVKEGMQHHELNCDENLIV